MIVNEATAALDSASQIRVFEGVKKAMKEGFSTAPDWVRDMGFGAGMGLPNIHNCADEMNIKTEVSKGTDIEFSVFLPAELYEI